MLYFGVEREHRRAILADHPAADPAQQFVAGAGSLGDQTALQADLRLHEPAQVALPHSLSPTV